MKKLLSIFCIAGALAFYSCGGSETKTAGSSDSTAVKADSTMAAGVYQCPMKCEGEKTYAEPGKCPVCGMDLEKVS